MNKTSQSALLKTAALFEIDGTPVSVSPLGEGLINDTYLVETQDDAGATQRYVLQRINTDVFRDPTLLQSNLKALTAHICRSLAGSGVADIERRVLTCIDALDGSGFVNTDTGAWRMTKFIPDTVTVKAMTPERAESTGRAFGQFHTMLAADDAPVLGETIPDFHNVPFRIRQLRDAAAADVAGRLDGVSDIVTRLLSREEEMILAERLHAEGKLPKRICHCDTKVDNILFDHDGEILCVIDLDTTMPGFVMSDFGDFIRTAANTGREDDPELDRVGLDMEIFRRFAEGYVAEAGFLTETEKQTLPHGAQRLTYMQAVRFLTDYLNGDVYYKISYPEHNLVRTKAQLKLLESIDGNIEQMNKYINFLSES